MATGRKTWLAVAAGAVLGGVGCGGGGGGGGDGDDGSLESLLSGAYALAGFEIGMSKSASTFPAGG
jgi:hypothetical protein